jgi:LmbE family N-acetylglucosaminyl deacetylase
LAAFDLDPGHRWLFCATHPDDELAIVAWMRRLVVAGVDVFVSFTHHTPEREREARTNLARIGVPHDRQFYWGATDGQVAEEIGVLLPQFEQMARDVAPTRIVCGAFEQGHLDHDATNLLVHLAFGDREVFEMPLYHTYLKRLQTLNRFADPAGEEVIALDPEERRLKIEYARGFPSQRIWAILVGYELYGRMTFRPPRLAETERLRRQTHFDYSVPNLPAPVAERVLRSAAWRRWVEAVRPWL